MVATFKSSRTRDAVAADLRRLVAPDCVLADEESLRPYECDGLSAYRRLPLVVVMPETIAQVQAIARYCREGGIPLVARGAGTGLSGGALPIEDGVLCSLAKFNQVLAIDPANRTATVQPPCSSGCSKALKLRKADSRTT